MCLIIFKIISLAQLNGSTTFHVCLVYVVFFDFMYRSWLKFWWFSECVFYASLGMQYVIVWLFINLGVVVWDDDNSAKRAFAKMGMKFTPAVDSGIGMLTHFYSSTKFLFLLAKFCDSYT